MRYGFAALVLVFWLMGAVNTAHINSSYNDATDGTSEQLVGYSSRKFATEGFWKTYLLPRYPAFGEDINGNRRTGEFVYNHYLAGADIVLALWIKVFGENTIAWARLVPHTLTVAATAALCWSAGGVFGGPLLASLLFAALLCARALTSWSICLYAHSYATAMAFFFMAYTLRHLGKKQAPRDKLRFLAANVAFGFFVTWFSLDWVMGTLITALALTLALGRRWDRSTAATVVGYGSGVALALFYQFTLSALYFGSYGAVIDDLTRWIGLRSGIDSLRAGAAFATVHVDRSVNWLIREFNKQAYGATGWTGFNLVALGVGFSFLGYASRVLKKKEAWLSAAAVVLGYVASSIWHDFMRHHAAGNMHFVLRHYLMIYLVAVAVILRVSLLLTQRQR